MQDGEGDERGMDEGVIQEAVAGRRGEDVYKTRESSLPAGGGRDKEV